MISLVLLVSLSHVTGTSRGERWWLCAASGLSFPRLPCQDSSHPLYPSLWSRHRSGRGWWRRRGRLGQGWWPFFDRERWRLSAAEAWGRHTPCLCSPRGSHFHAGHRHWGGLKVRVYLAVAEGAGVPVRGGTSPHAAAPPALLPRAGGRCCGARRPCRSHRWALGLGSPATSRDRDSWSLRLPSSSSYSRRAPRPPGAAAARRGAERVWVPALPAGGSRAGRSMAAASRVFAFRDARWTPDPVLEPSAAVRTPQPVPLVIDNGSFQTRAGWASADPAVPAEPLLRFRSLAARSRGARGGAGAETQVGNDLGSPEPLRWLLRSPFDRNVPVQLELQELLFDHIFQRLGVASQVPPAGRGDAGSG